MPDNVERLPVHPFSVSEAERGGVSPSQLREFVRAGVVQSVTRGAYQRIDQPLSRSARIRAVATRTEPHVIVCDRTAAWIHGVDTFGFAEGDVEPPVETVALRGRNRTERRECERRARDLLPEDYVEIDGVRVTTPLRTAVDLACRLRRPEALAAVDALMRVGGFTRSDMLALLRRFRRRRGVRQAREIVRLGDPRAESPRESWTRLALHDAGLPEPELQLWVERDGVLTYRLDLAYPFARIAVEYDGREFHSSPQDRAADWARRDWLRSQGWVVIVLTAESFSDGHLEQWVARVRDELAERAAQVRRRDNVGGARRPR